MAMMMDTTPAMRTYLVRTFASMGAYVCLNVVALVGVVERLATPGAVAIALGAAAMIAVQMWATLALMRDSDEFLRGLMARRFIVAAGLAMSLFSAWGFCEAYAGAPHVPGFMVYPLFWACWGPASLLVRNTRA